MKEMSRADVTSLLQEEIRKAGSQKVVAYRLGISEQYLSDILKWKPIGPKVLQGLKLEAVTTTVYREKE